MSFHKTTIPNTTPRQQNYLGREKTEIRAKEKYAT